MNIICHESPYIDSVYNVPTKNYENHRDLLFVGAPSVHEHIILNDKCAEISFEINGKKYIYDTDIVCGKFTHAPKIKITFKDTNKKLIIIRLTSCGMFKLTDKPIVSLVNNVVPRSVIDSHNLIDQRDEHYIKLVDSLLGSESHEKSYIKTQQIIQYINSNFTHLPANIADVLSQEFDISVSTLRRYFKKYIGINLSTYIINIKRKKMIQSLYDDNYDSMSVRVNGYYDQSHFLNDFKRLYGVPLKKYFFDMKILQKQAPEFMQFLYHCNIQSDT